jgi:hypothetical protein
MPVLSGLPSPTVASEKAMIQSEISLPSNAGRRLNSSLQHAAAAIHIGGAISAARTQKKSQSYPMDSVQDALSDEKLPSLQGIYAKVATI